MGASAAPESCAQLGMLTVETQVVTAVTFHPIQKYRLVSYNFPGKCVIYSMPPECHACD
jgi:hypothetical protein